MRLAAIDIGSNAIRLLIADINGDDSGQVSNFRKVKLYRLPVRLGMDAFTEGKISEQTETRLIKTMHIFKGLMDIYEVENYRACATSAMRESANAEEVIEKVKKETGVTIQVIKGEREANLIHSNAALLHPMLDLRFSHLYVDVGGGSTEISLLDKNGVTNSRSFKIGTIRLMKKMVKPDKWTKMGTWLEEKIKGEKPLSIIGSGGNINRIYKRSGNRRYEPLIYENIKRERDLLAALDLEDRVNLQDMNQDRAEVIVGALDIFLFVMEKTDIRHVLVPKIGVADGIVRELFSDLVLQ